MATDDYLADYALLGLQPGCSLTTLERAWRQGVSALHPDRAAQGSDPVRLGRRMHEISAAYKRLRQFEREHGRLPGAPLPAPEPVASAVVVDGADAEPPTFEPAQPVPVQGDAGVGRRIGGWLPMLALASAIAVAVWGLEGSGDPAISAPALGPQPRAAEPLGAALPTAGTGPAAVPPLEPTPMGSASSARRIRVGSTEADVERLMGAPIAAGPELWEYGPSHVRFVRGRVVGWYSSPLKPLPVDADQR